MIFPFREGSEFYRITTNAITFFSLVFTGFYYSRAYAPKSFLSKILTIVQRPIFKSNNFVLVNLATPSFIIICALFFFPNWQIIRSSMGLSLSLIFLIFNRTKIPQFFLFSLLFVLCEFKILNQIWAPESSTGIVFIVLVLITDLYYRIKAEVDETLFNFVNSATNDKVLTAQIVHDIRSPLGVLKLLIDQVEWKADQVEVREAVINSLSKISTISKTLLNENRKPIQLKSDASPILEAIAIVSTEFGELAVLEKNIDPGCNFNIDPTALYRITQNLVKNAFETRDVKEIRVIAERLDPAHCILSIRNDGIIPPTKVLEKILREGGTFQKSGGTGLGLKYCKDEVEKRGGTFEIKVRSGEFLVEIVL